MIPGQDLTLLTLAGGVPGNINRLVGESTQRTPHPTLIAEVLTPAVEPPAVTPRGLDDLADATVTCAPSCAHHWNGVCGLGMNPPIETVQRMSRRPVTRRPVSTTRLARSAICSTSPSVSVGRPHMKYSLT